MYTFLARPYQNQVLSLCPIIVQFANAIEQGCTEHIIISQICFISYEPKTFLSSYHKFNVTYGARVAHICNKVIPNYLIIEFLTCIHMTCSSTHQGCTTNYQLFQILSNILSTLYLLLKSLSQLIRSISYTMLVPTLARHSLEHI